MQKIIELGQPQHNTTDLIIKERIKKSILIAEAEKKSVNKNVASPANSLVIGINKNRDEIKKSITKRLKLRLNGGMVEEVKKLLESGITNDKLEFFGLEYKFISKYLSSEINYNDMFQKLNSAIHSFAKRQMTWFRKMEKEGIKINWIEGSDIKKAEQIIQKEFFL